MTESLTDMKQRFARQLILLLERAYGGRLPSLSSLARDLSLRSPHLTHVSTETVRKWIRGAALPQAPRMQVLVDWLGEDLLEPLTHSVEYAPRLGAARLNNNHADIVSIHNAIGMIETLEPADQKLVLRLIQSLSRKAQAATVGTPIGTPISTTTSTPNPHWPAPLGKPDGLI